MRVELASEIQSMHLAQLQLVESKQQFERERLSEEKAYSARVHKLSELEAEVRVNASSDEYRLN